MRGWSVLTVLAACRFGFDARLPENQPCGVDGSCPAGLVCDIATNECVTEIPEAAKFTQISAYGRHACGIDAEGVLWCWGDNRFGQLGLGDNDQRFVPTAVTVDTDWLVIAAGDNFTCGLRALDELWCWGDSAFPIDGSFTDRPRQIAGAYKSLSVGHDAWCAIGVDNTLTCQRRFAAVALEPIPVVPVQVTTSHNTTCAIDDAAQLWCWGDNISGQIGDGTNVGIVSAATPFKIPGMFQHVDMAEDHVCAIDTGGALSCWGQCGLGALGRFSNCFTPQRIDGTELYSAVSAGESHTCAISNGRMICFGSNAAGELGRNGGLVDTAPIAIAGVEEWTSVMAASQFTCGLRGVDHEAWCWGTNERGELGDGGGGIALEPVLADVGPFENVSVGNQTGCGIHSDGTLWCWGSNSFGQLGDGSTVQRSRPVRVGTDADWLVIATARTSTCGIRAPGTLWCWGNNEDSQVGIGSTPRVVLVPTQVGVETTWSDVAVGENNACGVLAGTLFCWGLGSAQSPESTGVTATSLDSHRDQFTVIHNGQVLDFSPFEDPLTSVASPLVADWTSIDRGSDHACGLRGDQVWCFGLNFIGQLGIDDPSAFAEAVQEQTLASWTQVSAGLLATCAIAVDGHLACFGEEAMIGNGDRDSQSIATTIGAAQWKSISVGGDSVCGVQIDGSLYCWGFGNTGGRADGRGGRERPTRVTAP